MFRFATRSPVLGGLLEIGPNARSLVEMACRRDMHSVQTEIRESCQIRNATSERESSKSRVFDQNVLLGKREIGHHVQSVVTRAGRPEESVVSTPAEMISLWTNVWKGEQRSRPHIDSATRALVPFGEQENGQL